MPARSSESDASPAAASGGRRLPLVGQAEQLGGQTSPSIERFVRSLTKGSSPHLGVLRTFATLTRSVAAKSVPPSLLPALSEPLLRLLDSPRLLGPSSLAELASSLREALPKLEASTLSAILATPAAAPTPSPSGKEEGTWRALNEHAEAVLARYVTLSVHLVGQSIFFLLEAAQDPTQVLEIVQNLGASRAYQQVALGSLRHAAFRERAFLQAEWDAERPSSRTLGQTAHVLAPQILHEFLGARFRAYAQAEHVQIEAFLAFAFAGAARA